MNSIEIIVSRYNEDLSWTKEDIFNEFKYVVYNKGINDNFEKINVKQIINVNNVGRESETYLNYIVTNYYNLPDVVIFFPGSLELTNKKERAMQLLYGVKKYKTSIFLAEYIHSVKDILCDFELDNWASTSVKNLEINNESKLELSKIRPYGNWFNYCFGDIKVSYVCYWGIFSIDKRDVLQHPIERYANLKNQLSNSSNPEVGHYIERSWCAIFHPMNYTKIFLKTNITHM